tara:strand:+ start:752 stop:1417 length:666 start_codon:yes stop_codon:yes gene_type:complete
MKLLLENWRKYLNEGDLVPIWQGKENIIDRVFDFLDWTPMRKENGKEAYTATILNLKNKGYTPEMIANKIDQMEMDAIYSDLMSGSSELYGNCGMLAVALLEEGIRRGKEVEVVFLHSAEDPLEDEDYDLYHVAIYYDGKYYDDRGEVTEEQLAELAPLGLTSPEGSKPERGRDYNLDAYKVQNEHHLSIVLNIVKSLTNWSKTCKEYKQRAVDFWDGMEK